MAPLPELELEPGCTITLEALSPTTGATVNGVRITDATIYAREGAGDGDLAPLEAVWLEPAAN